MKKVYTVLIFVISILLVGNLATAQVLNIWIDGDRVVYDVPNEKYFYPHLSTFFGKTYYQQEDAISNLNYAEINEWRWAYYADMMPLRVSMFGDLIPQAFNMVNGKNTDRFFMHTGMMSIGGPPGYITHGRTGDEDGESTGAIISAQMNPVPPFTEPLAPRYTDFGVLAGDGRPPNQFLTLPRADYGAPYFIKGSEAQDHYFEIDKSTGSYMYNDDLNYTAEDEPFVWQGGELPCGAWTVYDGGKILEVESMDIEPFSSPNIIDLNSRFLLVAILTTPDFNANTIDVTSIRVGPDPGGIALYKARRKYADVDKDGDQDMLLFFKFYETGIWEGDVLWGFYAETYSGEGHVFVDEIETVDYGCLKIASVLEEDLTFEADVDVYPNPFSYETNIRFQLPEDGHVLLKVYNTTGQEIQILANAPYDAGTHIVRWDGSDMSGNKAPSGIYIYRIQLGDKVLTDRIQLVR